MKQSLAWLSSGYKMNSSKILSLSQSPLPFPAERAKLVLSVSKKIKRQGQGKARQGTGWDKFIFAWDKIRVKQTSHRRVVALNVLLEDAQMPVPLQKKCKMVPGLFGECMLSKNQLHDATDQPDLIFWQLAVSYGANNHKIKWHQLIIS